MRIKNHEEVRYNYDIIKKWQSTDCLFIKGISFKILLSVFVNYAG